MQGKFLQALILICDIQVIPSIMHCLLLLDMRETPTSLGSNVIRPGGLNRRLRLLQFLTKVVLKLNTNHKQATSGGKRRNAMARCVRISVRNR